MGLNHFGIGVRIDGLDVAPVVIEGGTIEYGRQDQFDQPSPPICTLTLFTKQGWPQNPEAWFEYGVGDGQWSTGASGFVPTHDTDDTYIGPLAGLYIGAPVWVAINTASGFLPDHDTQDTYLGESFRRFTGVVQAIDYSRETIQLTCVGTQESWNRVGLFNPPTVSWPIERDWDRAQRIAELVPSPTVLHLGGEAAGLFVAKSIDADFPTSLNTYLSKLATDCGGLFYQDREGRVWYRSRNYMYLGALPIPSGIVDAESLGMSLELGDVANWLRLTWRTVDDSDPDNIVIDNPTETVDDPASIDRYGYRFATYDTNLGDVYGAYAQARTLLDARGPRWEMPDATIYLSLASDAEIVALATLDLGSMVEIGPMPTGAPTEYVVAELLGYTENLSQSDWTLDLHLAPHITPYPETGPG